MSCNALSDLAVAVEAVRYAPIHHVVQCVTSSISSQDTNPLSLGACLASPPDLVDNHGSLTRVNDSAYNERFQTLLNAIKRKKRASSQNQKLNENKDFDP
jgi:hypothetical protein